MKTTPTTAPTTAKPNSIIVMEYASKLLDWQIDKGLELTFAATLEHQQTRNEFAATSRVYSNKGETLYKIR